MFVERLYFKNAEIIPLMAALPYAIKADGSEDAAIRYDPDTQLTLHAGRNYSVSRLDECVAIGERSMADTHKDD